MVLLSQVLVNLLSIRTLRYMIWTSVTLNSIGALCIAVSILARAPHHQSAHFVFSKFFDGTGQGGAEGWGARASNAYVAVIGILMPQYTILGYDASAHLCEETRKAVRDAPMGLILAIAASALMGFFFLVCLLFAIQDFETVRRSPLPVMQIFIDACGKPGGTALMVIVLITIWHCGLFSLVRILNSTVDAEL